MAQLLRSRHDRRGRALRDAGDDGERQRGDHAGGGVEGAARDDAGDMAVLDDELLDLGTGADRAAELLDALRHALPHLAGPQARIVEAADQRRGLRLGRRPQGGAHRRREGELADPLGGPVGAQLAARHTPDLLGVGAEEDLVETTAEAAGDPLLEGVLRTSRTQPRRGVAEPTARELRGTELAHELRRRERVVDEAAAVEDPREARTLEQLVAEDLVPELLDLGGFRVEAVAAEIEPPAVADLGAREAADDVVALKNGDVPAVAREHVRRGEPGRAGAEDDDRAQRSRPSMAKPTTDAICESVTSARMTTRGTLPRRGPRSGSRTKAA
ncbi:unannotated protein [freshwater metagenome]|uniref:Unannotated protein n=1 Tax=freshwater metagenome TaxID=449393 RepID=A0A6J7ERV3_9ZZZZ